MWCLIVENQFGRKDRYVSDVLTEDKLDCVEEWYNENMGDENWLVVNAYKLERGGHKL